MIERKTDKFFHNIHILAYIFIHDIIQIKKTNFKYTIFSLHLVYENEDAPQLSYDNLC